MTADRGETIAAEDTVAGRLALKSDGPARFTGRPVPTLRGTMFGGQIIGQCMAAALGTVVRHPWPVSLQLYFIAAPEPDTDIVYQVAKRRDGGRYAWRHVLATQHDEVVVEAIAAFSSRPAEGAEPPRPLGVPLPDDRDGPAWQDRARLEREEAYFGHLTMGVLDVRFVSGSPARRLSAGDREPRQQFWVRPVGISRWGPREVTAALAMLSDVNMLAMPLLAIGELGDGPGVYAMSFDHNLRFYSPLDELGWLLFRQESVVIAGTTVEARGVLYAPDGRVVFTVNQQGVVLSGRIG
jgi:acyl-CoA thioesterase-2